MTSTTTAFLYGDSETRKKAPMCEGLLWYFPDACASVAAHSLESNERHNPGERLHHARDKSTDHADCIIRHLAHSGTVDNEGISERIAIAWRALAFLQEGLEELRNLPLPPNARLSRIPPPDYDPNDVAFRKETVRKLAQEAQSWGVYADADTTEKSPLAGTRIATSKASAALDIPTLRNAGIGDVKCNPRAAHDAKIAIDMAWDAWRSRTDFGAPAETAYLASFAPNPHPMMAETLRDEYEKTDRGTGL